MICLDVLIKPEEGTTDLINLPMTIKVNTYFYRISSKIRSWIESLKYTYKEKEYMITPCKHVFHSLCLTSWMNLKHECPYCRRIIPPLE